MLGKHATRVVAVECQTLQHAQPVVGKRLQLKLDIWLDPAREWYPVKLRFTEADGEYLEMVLTDAAPLEEQEHDNTSNE